MKIIKMHKPLSILVTLFALIEMNIVCIKKKLVGALYNNLIQIKKEISIS
jgi:hypothetical protein